ncbi:uncharacterized protein LOC128681903 isoform X3 [Plodia interpunctella]|uniref:uncharacterized protein LOC128681903 isoform X3 n=1 Tax=Plodia interpunctella TaxID=58824 RepID=UPI002368DAEB|nr:uncharacterized protein LOC128681903 isoform X3 [Plodia interpunctella]
MDEAFEKMKKEGKNDVDSLVKWMKDSKLVEDTKANDEKLRALFENEANKQAVELESFRKAVNKLAEEQKKTVDTFFSNLAAQGPKILEALAAGASAAQEVLTKK